MRPDTLVVLDAITFADFEVPEKIPFGGAHRLSTHQLPGGVRVIDAMGGDDADLTWSGTFYGRTALRRARFVDTLRKQGNQIKLSWGSLSYTVVIANFVPDYERVYQIPYTISCRVVQDLTSPVLAPPPSVDDLANADMANTMGSATALGMTVPSALPGSFSSVIGSTPVASSILPPPSGPGIDLTGLAGSLSVLRTQMQGVNTFVGAGPSVLIPVNQAVAGAQISAAAVMETSETTLAGPGGVAGVTSGIPGAAAAVDFLAYAAVARQASLTQPMTAFLARLGANISQGAT